MASERVAFHGRGGAGNVGKADNHAHTEDLITPTLKSETYTTGRGGTGNMAHNDPERPEVARAAQDVTSPSPAEATGPQHYGRGGAANIVDKDGQPVEAKAGRESQGAGKGVVEKGRELLGKLGKK